MACRDTIGVLVVDSGAFIKAALLENWSKNVVTIKEVVSEIRDEHTRRRLQVLPYDLGFREPSQEALHHGEFETTPPKPIQMKVKKGIITYLIPRPYLRSGHKTNVLSVRSILMLNLTKAS